METKGPEGQTERPQEASAATKEGGGESMGMGMMKKIFFHILDTQCIY